MLSFLNEVPVGAAWTTGLPLVYAPGVTVTGKIDRTKPQLWVANAEPPWRKEQSKLELRAGAESGMYWEVA